jgi:hypothetical protein
VRQGVSGQIFLGRILGSRGIMQLAGPWPWLCRILQVILDTPTVRHF